MAPNCDWIFLLIILTVFTKLSTLKRIEMHSQTGMIMKVTGHVGNITAGI
jgi:hypothetical protein